MTIAKAAIFISGRGSNMEALIRSSQTGVLSGLCDIQLVLSNREGAPGIAKAQALHIPVAVINSKGKNREEFESAAVEWCESANVNLILLAGFDRILSPFFITHYKNRIINIHPADTRKFQGLNGYAWAFEQKLISTKITLHFVDEGVDTGDIIAQSEVDLSGADSLEEVTRRGLAREHSFYAEALAKFLRGDFPLINTDRNC